MWRFYGSDSVKRMMQSRSSTSEISPALRDALIAQFQGGKCACGRPKRMRVSFCPTCYFALPMYLRNRLWDNFGGSDWGVLYLECCKALKLRVPGSEAA